MVDSVAPTPVPVPVRELGYTNPRPAGGATWWDLMEDEATPELQWPANLEVFDRMESTDAQVGSVLRAVSSPITRTPWRIDGKGCRDEVVQHVAEDLGLPIVGQGNDVPAIRTRGRFSWAQHLTEALDAQKYGHQVFEQVYRIDDRGLAHLRKLGIRRGRSIVRWNTARDGGLVSVEQMPPANAANGVVYSGSTNGNIVLPVRRLVVYSHDRRGGHWIGRSLLRSVYRNWILKDRLLRVQTQSIERNGMGIPIYTGAEGEADLSTGRALAAQIRAGDNAGAAIPHKAELELMGVTGAIADASKPITYHDEQIARAVLAQFLTLGGSSSPSSSYALAGVGFDFFTLALQATAEWVRDTATQHIIEDLVDLNWGENEPAPRLVFDEIGSRADAVVQAVAFLVQSGVLRADESLEEFVRTTLGLPSYEGDQPFGQPAPAAPAAPAANPTEDDPLQEAS